MQSTCINSAATLSDLHKLMAEMFGWDNTHNYFFSQGVYRYEDPAVYETRDRVSAECNKLYSAADIAVGCVLGSTDDILYYVYNLANSEEFRISLISDQDQE